MEEHHGRGAGEAVAPHADDHRIQQRAGQGVGDRDDNPEQRDVVARDGRPRRGRHVQADRVRKAHPVRHDLREVVAAAEHPLEPVRVEHGIDDRLERVEQHEELNEQGAGREGHDKPGGRLERTTPPLLDDRDAQHHPGRNPHRGPGRSGLIEAVGGRPGRKRHGLRNGQQRGSRDGAPGRQTDEHERRPENRARDRRGQQRAPRRKGEPPGGPADNAIHLHAELAAVGRTGHERRGAGDGENQAGPGRLRGGLHVEIPIVVGDRGARERDPVDRDVNGRLHERGAPCAANADRTVPRNPAIEARQPDRGAAPRPGKGVVAIALDRMEAGRDARQIPIHVQRDHGIPGEGHREARGPEERSGKRGRQRAWHRVGHTCGAPAGRTRRPVRCNR